MQSGQNVSWEMAVNLLRMRKVQRTLVVAFLISFILLVYSFLPQKRIIGPYSAITCKSKIAQIVMPSPNDVQKYIEGLGNDAGQIEDDYFNFVATLTRGCFSQMHIGPEGDGGWDVCVERQYDIASPCLVYSFGVGDDEFLFEKSAEEKLGCEVHAFDPSMGLPSMQFSKNGFFHNFGLDSADTYAFNGEWKLRRLKTIMRELGHEGRTIDLLKMDIEFSEWPALYDMMKTGLIKDIRQLLMEVHTPEMDIHHRPDHLCTWSTRETLAFLLKTLMDLHNSGFNTFYTSTNHRTYFKSGLTGKERYCCHNMHLVNTKHKDNQINRDELV